MFVNRPAVGDFKENVKLVPSKMSVHSSQKGLKSRSLNSVSNPTNLIQNKKSLSLIKGGSCSTFAPVEKENSKPKIKESNTKVKLHIEEESWSDIEEMHIYAEPDDDYEDILPKCDRIQKRDIDALFFNYTSVNFTELTVDKPPSPFKEFKNIDIEVYSPLIPGIKASLYDDTELDFIPL